MENRKAAELRWIEEADERERSARRLPTLGEVLRRLETQPTAPHRNGERPRTGIFGASMAVSWPKPGSGVRLWRVSRAGGPTPGFAARRRSRHSVEGLG